VITEEALELQPKKPKMSSYDELNAALQDQSAVFNPEKEDASSKDILLTLKREMSVYESTGCRPSSLELLFKALMTIPPTSVEAERVFSAAGLFVTKMRSSLNDDTVDVLCFLRSHFSQLNKQ
jgi:hypothetical protein